MTVDLSNLNDNQKSAVEWGQGPLLVLAGPGSGKTRVLTLRIARLVEESPKDRFRVLGVTFTNKAAMEMRTRIDQMLGTGRERVLLTTFHSFAAEILRQHGSHAGLKPDFTILAEQADREAVLADAIKEAVDASDEYQPTPAQLFPVVSRMLDECLSVSDASEALKEYPHGPEVAKVYAAYRDKLVKANQMDFGSLLARAVELLETNPALAKQMQRVYKHVCVDEFQDTNAAQFRLLVQLVPKDKPNLFVVADDDQVIYEWNGASPGRLRDLRERFAMDVVQLPENYRCPPEVITLANNLILFNDNRAPDKKPLTAHKKAGVGDVVSVFRFPDAGEEAKWLAGHFAEQPSAYRSSSVVLARRKRLLEDAVSAMADRGVPGHIAVRKNEFQSAPYRWLHATLRLANTPQDREQLRRLTRSFYQLDGSKIELGDVVAKAAVDQSSLLRTWIEIAESTVTANSAARPMLGVARSALVDRMDYWNFVDAAHAWFNVVEANPGSAEESAFNDFQDELEIWNSLKTEIRQQHDLKEMSLHQYLQELDLRAKEKPAPNDSVRCLTIAGSKGLEFKHVYLIGLAEDELPSFYAKKKGDNSDEMREERRNCFVAITRAEETLTITFAERYSGYPKKPSRFLGEMGYEV